MIPTPLLLALAVVAPASPGEVLARVDHVSITRADLDERLRVLASRRSAIPAAKAIDDLVDEALLAAEARRQGLERTPEVAAEIDRQLRRLASDAYIASIADKTELTDAQLREAYHASGDQVRLTLAKFTSEAEARAAFDRVAKGGDLATEARRSADGGLAARGGDTGWMTRGLVEPALASAAFEKPVGSLVGPLQLQLGWAVARIAERSVADEAGFARQRAALAARLRERAAAEYREHIATQLRSRSGVKLDEPFLASLGSRTDVTQAELDHVVATVNGRPLAYRAAHPQVVRIFRAVRNHGAGSRTRIQAVWQEVEARLFSDEAIARGFGDSPAVRAVLPGIERNLLAAAVAARLGKGGDLRDPAVRTRLEALRRQAKVQVERDRVAAYRAN